MHEPLGVTANDGAIIDRRRVPSPDNFSSSGCFQAKPAPIWLQGLVKLSQRRNRVQALQLALPPICPRGRGPCGTRSIVMSSLPVAEIARPLWSSASRKPPPTPLLQLCRALMVTSPGLARPRSQQHRRGRFTKYETKETRMQRMSWDMITVCCSVRHSIRFQAR
jgi:hypothetical protein